MIYHRLVKGYIISYCSDYLSALPIPAIVAILIVGARAGQITVAVSPATTIAPAAKYFSFFVIVVQF